MKKPSCKAIAVLAVIDKATLWEGDVRPGKKLTRYWTPHHHVPTSNEIWGAGDASILRSLERNGLIKPERDIPYSYSITEEGILALAKAREQADL